MLPVNELESNNNHILGEFLHHTKIHEHDFVIRTEKEQTSIICCICGLVYCEKCGKLIMMHDKSYMYHNIYN
jgi:hypothetical protein